VIPYVLAAYEDMTLVSGLFVCFRPPHYPPHAKAPTLRPTVAIEFILSRYIYLIDSIRCGGKGGGRFYFSITHLSGLRVSLLMVLPFS